MNTFNLVGFVKNLDWNAKILVVGLSLLSGPFGNALAGDQEQDFKILDSDIVLRAFEPLSKPRRSNQVIVTPLALDFEPIFLKDGLTSSEKAAVKRLQALEKVYIRRLANQQVAHAKVAGEKYENMAKARNAYTQLLLDQPFLYWPGYWSSVESARHESALRFIEFYVESQRAPALNEPLQKN